MPTYVPTSSHPSIVLMGSKTQDATVARLKRRSTGRETDFGLVDSLDLEVIHSRVVFPEGGLPDGDYSLQFINKLTGNLFSSFEVRGVLLEVSAKEAAHLVILYIN
jgi:hypothetical protein